MNSYSNSYPKKTIAITVAVSFVVSLLFNWFAEWQRYESFVETYPSPVQYSGTTPGGLPIDSLTFWDKLEMLFHTAEVESKTEAKKSENAEKHDNESQTP